MSDASRAGALRAVVVGRAYADPAARGKLRALTGLGCAVGAVVPAEWRSPSDGRLHKPETGDDGGTRILAIPARRGAESRWDGTALRRALAEFRPDVVQLEEEPGTRAAAQVRRAAARLGIALVACSSEGRHRIARPLQSRMRRRRVLREARGLVGSNRLALESLADGRASVPHSVIPPLGITPPLTPVAPPSEGSDDRLVIGFVGRLRPEKGVDLLLRAAAWLRSTWSMEIVGTGPALEELETLVTRLGIAGRVTWHGALPASALAECWRGFDCLVLPSRTTEHWIEDRGRTVLEAMAHGLPVVTSDSGVLPELVGEAGIVVPEGDVDALAVALHRLLAQSALRARLGADARRRVLADFSDAAVARRTLEFWHAVLAPRA
ncbi:MAG TPA: glycosyltransferase [Gemmatimonadales bacterium]|nr:glycosyltransferase [Gemmatimonadales bacterium]